MSQSSSQQPSQSTWQDFVEQFQKEVSNKDSLITFILSQVIPFITKNIYQMQLQVYNKKDQLSEELPFYKDYPLKEKSLQDGIYQKILNKLNWFTLLISSKFTQTVALSYVEEFLKAIQQFQQNMQQMYATFIDKGCYSSLCIKCVEQYVPSAIIDLFKKECLLDNVGCDINLSMNSKTGFLSRHRNIKNIGLIKDFQHLVKLKEITELQILYVNLYMKIHQRPWIKDHITDPQTFWTKPSIISVIHFYLYNEEINKNNYLCLSNIFCSDELMYIINRMLRILQQ